MSNSKSTMEKIEITHSHNIDNDDIHKRRASIQDMTKNVTGE